MMTRKTGYRYDPESLHRRQRALAKGSPFPTTAHLPDASSVSLPWVTDQGDTNACTGHAARVMIDALAIRAKSLFRACPWGLYRVARHADPGDLVDEGAHFRGVFEQAMEWGIPMVGDREDDATTVLEGMGLEGAVYAARNKLRPSQWYALEATKDARLLAIKQAITAGYAVGGAWPVTLGFASSDQRFFDEGGTRYRPDLDTTPWHGNHAMAIVAYRDKGKEVCLQNSWGTNFGEWGRVWVDRLWLDSAWDLTVCTIEEFV